MNNRNYQNDWLDELKSKIDIVDVVSQSIPLTQKGRNFWGRCPFHNEKTPSFAVNQDRQVYHCFGCGEGGDAIKFIEKTESLGFMDAVRFLADKVGFEIPELRTDGGEATAQKKKRRDRLYGLLRDTARFYYANLKTAEAGEALRYMQSRGIDSALAKTFGIGVSTDFNALPAYLKGKGYTEEEMVASGACAKNSKGNVYDSLGGRLIFPVIDSLGNVVAFGGRQLEQSDYAKYKNTAQTEVFDKSRNLYNVNLAKKNLREEKSDFVIVVEGYMDVLSLYGAGFKNTVAGMGTALTPGQIQLIKRMVSKVYISYDGDTAGKNATMRGLDMLQDSGVEVLVISLPDGKDPDDVIKEGGSGAYAQLIEDALPYTEYKLSEARKKYRLEDKVERRKYVMEALAVIQTLASDTEKEDYLKQLKQETGFTYESLKNDLGRIETVRVERGQEKDSKPAVLNREEKAVRFILQSMLSGKEYAFSKEDISSCIDAPLERELYERLLKNGTAISPDEMRQGLRETAETALAFRDVPQDGAEERNYFDACVRCLKIKNLENAVAMLTEEMSSATDKSRRAEIGKRLTESIHLLQELQGGTEKNV